MQIALSTNCLPKNHLSYKSKIANQKISDYKKYYNKQIQKIKFLKNLAFHYQKNKPLLKSKNNKEDAFEFLNKLPGRYDNLKQIQNSFLQCYFGTAKTEIAFEKLIKNNEDHNFSR